MGEPDHPVDDRSSRWLDDREQRAWRALLALHQGLNRAMERQLQRDAGLSGADYSVLVHLSESPDQRVRHFELSAALDWEKSRLSHHLSRMVARGLVGRERCPEDSRGGYVVLTDLGRAAIEQAAPSHVAHVRQWFIDRLSDRHLDALIEMEELVCPHLEDQR